MKFFDIKKPLYNIINCLIKKNHVSNNVIVNYLYFALLPTIFPKLLTMIFLGTGLVAAAFGIPLIYLNLVYFNFKPGVPL